MNKTSIGWTDFTSNPFRARHRETGKAGHYCEKVSPGCAHCYASEWNENRYGTGLAFLPANRDKVEVWLNEDELREWSKPKYAGKRVFVCDMTDLFVEWVPDEWLDKVFAAMALAPQTTFQVLTKRPQRMREYFADTEERVDSIGEAATALTGKLASGDPPDDEYAFIPDLPFDNVWLGVSVENQHWADVRIPILLDTPAEVRFLSCEPLLGPLALEGYLGEEVECIEILREEMGVPVVTRHTFYEGIRWVIVGGESGSKRRRFDIEWARDLKTQCDAAGVAYFFKQTGAFYPGQPSGDPELDAAKAWPEVSQ